MPIATRRHEARGLRMMKPMAFIAMQSLAAVSLQLQLQHYRGTIPHAGFPLQNQRPEEYLCPLHF